jgi:YD repeat-containing protein
MARRTETVLIALSIAGVTATAMASETINYSYDARGRLTQVKHSGNVNDNVSSTYTYDKAGNRNNLNVVSPNSPPP